MSPERRQKRLPRFTLEEVTRLAKETAIQSGGHTPTIIAEGASGSAIGQLKNLPGTHQDRARSFYTAGHALAQSGEVGVLKQVFLISEAWISIAAGDKALEMPPSQDPDRKEVLVVYSLRVEGHRADAVFLEMLRDAEGQLADLKDFKPGGEEEGRLENPLLDAFVDGFRVAMSQKLN